MRGLATALLGVLLLSGCSANTTVRLSGLETEWVADAGQKTEEANKEQQITAVDQTELLIEDGTAWQNGQQTVQNETAETESAGYVYVCGAVKHPGVYPVTQNMRIFEAVECAGGFLVEADEQWLNLASLVADGQQIYVYTKAETQDMEREETTAPVSSEVKHNDSKVNLNSASREELMTLPGIGSSKADAIIQYRTDYGGFAQIEDIMNISGIKEAVFSKIKNNITV